ncbi:MAG: hypothetical protein K1X61_13435 [Chitinophagales bacterium]|nr:hypothetical protein [Chitinophagales bacterium]
MLLQIWFPQIVMVVGGAGALLCFVIAFAPEIKHGEHHDDEHAGHGQG